MNKTLRGLSTKRYRTRLDHFSITTVDGRKQNLTAAPGLTILCGGNGAGKSTTLGALWRCLSSDASGPSGLPPLPLWIRGVEISGTYDGTTWATAYEIPSSQFSGSCPVNAYYLDATAATEEIIRLVREDDNPGDLIEGIDAASFEPDLVAILSLILRRNYEEVEVYEVTSFSQDDEPVPFFTVSSMDCKYELPAMGRGELAAIYLLWSLSRIERGAIVLIEEPECHLADYSQRSLIDLLSYFAVKRDLTLITSSHSPGLFDRLPTDHVVLVSSLPIPGFRSGLSAGELRNYLGLEEIGKSALLVTEDLAASVFLRSVLDSLDYGLLQHVAICHCENGASAVERVIAEVRGNSHPPRFKVLGILDGDMRPADPETSNDDTAFLPGEKAPELVMREALNRWRSEVVKSWEPPLAGGVETLELELSRSDGLDHHDWLYSISQRYGGIGSFIRAATDLVLKNSALHLQAKELCSWLRGTLQP